VKYNSNKQLSDLSDSSQELSALLQMLLLGDDGDPLRGEDGACTDVLEEVLAASPENLA